MPHLPVTRTVWYEEVHCGSLPHRDAAVRLGVKPVLGFGNFGDEWLESQGITKDEEVEQAEADYSDDDSSSDLMRIMK
jgi:hypothetical protein